MAITRVTEEASVSIQEAVARASDHEPTRRDEARDRSETATARLAGAGSS